MRRTVLIKDGQRIIVETDAQGTQIKDGNTGGVIRTAGSDRHDEYVDEYERGGWTILEE